MIYRKLCKYVISGCRQAGSSCAYLHEPHRLQIYRGLRNTATGIIDREKYY